MLGVTRRIVRSIVLFSGAFLVSGCVPYGAYRSTAVDLALEPPHTGRDTNHKLAAEWVRAEHSKRLGQVSKRRQRQLLSWRIALCN